MSRQHFERKVGLFVFLGLVLVGLLLLQFAKGTSIFRGTYEIRMRASNIGGLRQTAAVLMSGVQVGRVSEINLAPDGKSVTIFLKVYEEYKIHPDARFMIEQSGFLGDQYVAIVPTENHGEPLTNNAVVIAEDAFNLQEAARSAAGFIRRVDETTGRLNDAIADVRRLVLNEETLTNLSVTVSTMRMASENALAAINRINTVVSTNSTAVDTAVSNVVFFSEQINEFATAFGTMVTTNTSEISAAVKNIESSTVVMKNLFDDLQAGKGLAGTVLRDETLAANVEAIANNLSITASNLNRRGLWGILWSTKPPRTNAPSATDPLVSPGDPFK